MYEARGRYTMRLRCHLVLCASHSAGKSAHLYICGHASHIHINIQNGSDIVKNAHPRLSICRDVVCSFKHIIRKPLQGSVFAAGTL